MTQTSPSAVLLISSPDRKGLVARITDFVFRHDGNILHSDEHIDEEAGMFLMRIEWDLAGFSLAREEIRPAFQPLAREFSLDWELRFSDEIPAERHPGLQDRPLPLRHSPPPPRWGAACRLPRHHQQSF